MSDAKTKKKTKGPELRVVFDTSALYTGSESDLVQGEVAAVIKEHSQHPDLEITWYLPHTVRHERQFRMQTKALELLQSIEKLERLLGHRLNITERIIKERVNAAVETQIQNLGLEPLEFDSTRVDWTRLILDACYRRPPFEDSEREKGFRDSLIVETFLQLVENSPKRERAGQQWEVSFRGTLERDNHDCRDVHISQDRVHRPCRHELGIAKSAPSILQSPASRGFCHLSEKSPPSHLSLPF